MSRLVEALQSGRVLLMDGAMGTELQRLGLPDGECPALWNLTHPEQVASVHAAYLEAGAEILLTNTFLANGETLAGYGLEHRIAEIWGAALAIARAFAAPTPLVLADVGPFSGCYSRQCREVVHLARSADGLLLETWTAGQARATGRWLAAANLEATGGPGLPLLISFTFADEPSLSLEAAAKACADLATTGLRSRGLEAAALGANCGRDIGLDDLLAIVLVYRQESDLPIFVRPNAGTPRRTASGWVYPRSPAQMADQLGALLEAGVTMVGGCCGTTPAHIAACRRVIDQWNARHT